MARKQYKCRGHTLEELQSMSMDDLIKILPSRVRRTMRRGLGETEKKFLVNVKKAHKMLAENGKIKPIKTHCRAMPVLPEMVGLQIAIYNGKEFITVDMVSDMIGQFLGEFALSRKQVKHGSPGVGATRSSLFVPIR